MFLYAKTYENIKTINTNFPIEDHYYYLDNIGIIADGITRDPVEDLSSVSFSELVKLYPRPSGAEIAALTVCSEYEKLAKTDLSLKQILIEANEEVKLLNDQVIKKTDYLVNDYYGTVAATIRIKNNILEYAYLCDCGVIVFDKDGNIKFQTEDDMSKVDKYFDTKNIPWEKPQARVIVRKNYRNKPENKYSYGALTGEETVKHYIREGKLNLETDDYIIVYSDGFTSYFERSDFFINLVDFNNNKFDNYVEKLAVENYQKYGRENH